MGPSNIYSFKANSRNTRKRREICPKLTMDTAESRSGVLIVNFEHIHTFFSVSIVDFE